MSYQIPSFDRMRGTLRAFFQFLMPDRNVSPLSLYGRLVAWIAAAVTDLHAHVASSERDAMPDTAEGAAADRHARLWGIERKGATPARRSSSLRVTGTIGTILAAGEQLTDPATGLIYEAGAGTVGGGGYVDVDLVAVDTGSKTRIPAGTVLEFVSPPAGITTQAEVQLDVDRDGQDQELTGALRLRYLAVIADRPLGGSPADFVSWALEVDGIAEAYSYPNRAGRGSVDVAALHANREALTAPERADLLAALQASAPCHLASGGDLRVLVTEPQEVAVELLVAPNGAAAYAFDWNDSVPPEVFSWDSATRTITLTADRPATMAVGHRLIIKDGAGDMSGAEVVIEALPTGSPLEVVLASLPLGKDGAPLTVFPGDQLYSGGPLVAPIREAILAHLNGEILYAGAGRALPASVAETVAGSTARLEVLALPVGTANPAGTYGAWSGTLYRSTLAGIATYTRGVGNVDVAVPAADVEANDPAYPDDASIAMLVAGRVIVRRA